MIKSKNVGMKVFDMPTQVAPIWQFWLARIFGETLHKEAGLTFKLWRNSVWVIRGK